MLYLLYQRNIKTIVGIYKGDGMTCSVEKFELNGIESSLMNEFEVKTNNVNYM